MNIGGAALKNGIMFYDDDLTAIGTIKNGKVEVTVKKNLIAKNHTLKKITDAIMKIPFLRGILNFLLNGRIYIVIIFYLIFAMSCELFFSSNISILVSNSMTNSVLILTVISVGYDLKNTQRCSFHAVEHMVINTINDNKKLTVENVKEASRLSHTCGTTLMAFYIICAIFFMIIIGYGSTAIFLSISAGYELYMINSEKKIVSFFYKISNFIQFKFFTNKPSDQQIDLAILTAKELIDKKQKY